MPGRRRRGLPRVDPPATVERMAGLRPRPRDSAGLEGLSQAPKLVLTSPPADPLGRIVGRGLYSEHCLVFIPRGKVVRPVNHELLVIADPLLSQPNPLKNVQTSKYNADSGEFLQINEYILSTSPRVC